MHPSRCYSRARSAPAWAVDEVSGNPGPERERRPAQSAWFACYTRARHEKRVDAQLRERGFEAYLPLVPRLRQWHDRRKVVEFPLFPGYVFVHAPSDDLSGVLSTRGIATVVRFDGRPAPIPEEDISNVRRFTRVLAASDGEWPEATPLVEEGQKVRVASGPFRGIEGSVLEDRGDNRTLIQVGMKAIGQGVKVEVATADLRPI